MATYPKKTADHRRATRKPVLSALFKRENLLAVGIVLMASSLGPFALADAGVFPDRIFYLTLMPIFLFYVLNKGKIRINPIIAFILGCQIIVICLVFLADGIFFYARLKTIGILLSIGLVSVMFRSDLLDIRVFVKVAVLFTMGVLLISALSTVFAYLGYFDPVPAFDRGGGEIVYQVGYTFSNEITPTGSGYFIRPSGVFVEPGMLAMYATLAIIANAVVLGNRKYELLLIFFGLFIGALSFYLSVFAFFILFRRWKAVTFCVVGFLVAALIFGGLDMIREDIILSRTLRRVINFFGENYGGNRYEATLDVLSNLDRLNALGSVNQDAFSNLAVDATFWGPFLGYGIVGGMFAYLHIILFAAVPFLVWCKHTPRSRVHTNMLAIFALLSLNLYHRPFTLHFLYYIYLIAMFEWEWRRYFGKRARSESI